MRISTGVPLADGGWARVWMTWDAPASTITVGQQPLLRGQPSGRAGLPATSWLAATFLVTTDPAAIIAYGPISTPQTMVALAPIEAP